MGALPRGTVTFLFTDIEGSTRRWERDRRAMEIAVHRHLALIRAAVEAEGGAVFKVIGDAAQAAFDNAPAALAAAVAAQETLVAEDWGDLGPLRVRMAIHAGVAEPDERGDYLAAPLNRLARLLGSGHGGQVLLTQAVEQLVRGDLPPGAALVDLGVHRLRDLDDPERVHAVVHPALRPDAPPLKTLDAARHNLPPQPTPFLGRERELAAVADRLRDPATRLLTLTGPGGAGKTRLALQAAAEALDAFPDGAAFVPLATLSAADEIAPAVARAVGVPDDDARDPLLALSEWLRPKRMLLVLDNAEHLAGATAETAARILEAAPGIAVLVTSRLPLRLRSEREHPVGALSVPPAFPPPTAAQLDDHDATRLFLARAEAVRPGFAATDDDAPDIAAICRRVDGLPLAIELAAARVRMLPPAALLARLDERLKLLSGGARDAPDRHRALEATIGWSHDLLSGEERAAFRRLAVFRDPFTLDAALAVIDAAPVDDPFGAVESMLQHSLLREVESGSGEPRFAMLQVIREFAARELAAAGDASDSRHRHSAWFAERVAALVGDGTDPDRLAASLERIDAESADLLDAVEWGREHGDPLATAAMIVGMRWWLFRRRLAEAVRHLAFVDAFDGRIDPAVLAGGRNMLGLALVRMGRAEDALGHLRASLEGFRQSGDVERELKALEDVAEAEALLGNLAEARAAREDILRRRRERGDPEAVADALNSLAELEQLAGDPGRALALLEEALPLARQSGAEDLDHVIAGNLACLAASLAADPQAAAPGRDADSVRDIALAALAGCRELDDLHGHVVAFLTLALLDAEADPAAAARWIGLADAAAAAAGSVVDGVEELHRRQALALAGDRLPAGSAERIAADAARGDPRLAAFRLLEAAAAREPA